MIIQQQIRPQARGGELFSAPFYYKISIPMSISLSMKIMFPHQNNGQENINPMLRSVTNNFFYNTTLSP